jgi:hypothetical protein
VSAQIAASVNDNNVLLDTGVAKVAANPLPSTVVVVDMKTPLRLLDQANAPTRVAGTARSPAVHAGGTARSNRC